MIRHKFISDINSTIAKHPRFDSSDFLIEPSIDSKTNTTSLSITYTILPKYKIVFKIPSSPSYNKEEQSSYYAFSGSACPGPFAIEETFSFAGENGVFSRITKWLDCIWEELSAHPIVRQIDGQQKQIDDILQQFNAVKDEYFSQDEAADLKDRLDELEETLRSQIHRSDEDKKFYEMEVERLHTDIETLKQTIGSFKKKGWIKSFTTKLFKWTSNSENRKMLKDGYSVLKVLLPEEIKNALPE